MSTTTPEKVLTIPQVADILQVPTSWLYAACKRGAFPHIKVGRYVRITEAQLQEWIEAGGGGSQ